MNKLLQKLDSDYTKDLIEKAKKHKQYLLGFLGLILLLLVYNLFIKENLKPIWKPVAPNLLFALHYSGVEVDADLDEMLKLLTGQHVALSWENYSNALSLNKNIAPVETIISWHTEFGENPVVLYNWRFEENVADSLIASIAHNPKLKTRQYRGEKIYEISTEKGNLHYKDNILTASSSPLLLEASIRTLTNSEAQVNATVVNQFTTQEIDLLINADVLFSDVSGKFGFTNREVTGMFALKLEASEGKLLAIPYSSKTSLFTQNATWQSQNLENDNILFHSKNENNFTKIGDPEKERLALLKERFGFDFNQLKKELSTNYSHYILKSGDVRQPYQVLSFALTDSGQVAKELAKLHPNESPQKEQFNQIRQPAFPSLLLPSNKSDFPNTFYLIHENVLWLSNFSLTKNNIAQLEPPSVSQNATYLYINHAIKYFLAGKLNDFAESFLDQIEFGSWLIQDNAMLLQLNLKEKEPARQHLDTGFIAQANRQVRRQIYRVKNHYSNEQEFVWQDAKTRLYLMSDSGEILWEKPVWYHAKSEIKQVDIYNNGKLQYAFASDGRLHVYDRLGRTVNGFPRAFPTYFEADFLLPFRWQNDKEQRFLVAGALPGNDQRVGGKLYLYNRYGGLARGWAPRNVEAPLACAPKLISHQGKDYILALLKNGSFYALDKNGKIKQGFPLITNLICDNAFVLDRAQNINFISEGGTFIKLDLQGSLLKREQIQSKITGTEFNLVPIAHQSGFIITVQQGKKLFFINEELETMFSAIFDTDSSKQVDVYNFGEGKQFYVVFDAKQNTCRLLKNTGEDWLDKALSTDIMPTLSLKKNRLEVVLSKGNTISKLVNGR